MRLSDFQIVEHEQKAIVVSDKGISRIVDTTLIRLMKAWSENGGQNRLDIQEQLVTHSLDASQTLKFLEDIIGFESKRQIRHFLASRVFFNSNSGFARIIARGLPTQQYTSCHSKSKKISPSSAPHLDILLMEDPASDKERIFYQTHLKENPKNAVIATYLIEDSMVMTAPHCPDIGNPCLYCTIDRVLHYTKLRTTKSSWAKLTAFFSENSISMPFPKLTQANEQLISALISLQIDLYMQGRAVCHQDNVYSNILFNLASGEMVKTQPTHWYLCNCRSNHV
jgi:McbB family protein